MANAMVQSGFPKTLVKTDNEPAVSELKRAATCLARKEAAIEVVLEESESTSIRPEASSNWQCRRSSARSAH